MSDLVPLTGEPLALDLINTCPTAGDLLASPGDLRSWWVLQADRLPEEVPQQVTAADLAAVRAVREHTARALDHVRRGEEPAAADWEALNRAQRAAPAVSEVAWTGSAVVATRRRDGSAGRRRAAVTKIRECESEDCVMLFLATHPRRRWCSAARCGNRVRVARHYQRHKAG